MPSERLLWHTTAVFQMACKTNLFTGYSFMVLHW